MPRKPCYWTRKLELDLVEFVRLREFIWRPKGNTNHHIQQKYKAYAEFAAILGRGFTARSVRDRWVNIRSTFNHNLRRVDKSRETAASSTDIYVPCWPLWQPLQFLKDVSKKEETNFETYPSLPSFEKLPSLELKDEEHSENETPLVVVRQRVQRTDRPRRKQKPKQNKVKRSKCKRVLDDLVQAMKPLVETSLKKDSYWFFGRHVTERLNSMQNDDAECASRDILQLLASPCDELSTEDLASGTLDINSVKTEEFV